MQPILKNNLEALTRILKSHKVKRAYAFGSVCTEKFNDESDVDFIIKMEDGLDPLEYGEHYFNALDEIRNLLKRDVDLVAEETIVNPYFIKVIQKTKTLIYE